jgi:Holliday junction resolvasome RuvABC DNA-binding subunit
MRYPKDYKPITPLEYATEQLTKALKRLEQNNQRPEVQAMIKQALEAAAN